MRIKLSLITDSSALEELNRQGIPFFGLKRGTLTVGWLFFLLWASMERTRKGRGVACSDA